MRALPRLALVAMAVSAAAAASDARPVSAQAAMDGHVTAEHAMWHASLGSWSLTGMAQAYPIVTAGDFTTSDDGPLHRTEWYLTQPALMTNLESGGSRIVLRTTLNFEGLTQEDGELTFGGWGEGYLDKRHPHTLLHEAMLSVNVWTDGASAFSISAGKGFAPYGTDDPMSRPGLKYPTNHHLSQVLERWTLNGVWTDGRWSLEAGLFGGSEPTGAYDLSNIESFGDSWSGRVTRRFGGDASAPGWEVSASYAHVLEHEADEERNRLVNGYVRHDAAAAGGRLYWLAEGSRSAPEHGDGYFSLLAEALYEIGGHQPYFRVEYATRPDFAREGEAPSESFFRYDHDAEAEDASRWLITSLAYAREISAVPWSVRPFVEIQHHRVTSERGAFDAEATFGHGSFWSLSAGARIFLGGGPMRMGSYGVLDAMTGMNRSMAGMGM